MASPVTDAVLARRLLDAALGGLPALEPERMDDLMLLATSLDESGSVQYTERDLNRAASLGWQWKAGLTANQYDLGGGSGKTLDRSQWFDHCMRMAAGYADGAFSVMGSPNASDGTRRSGIGVIAVGSSLAGGV